MHKQLKNHSMEENMKKKLLSLLLASVTALSVAGGLAACNNGSGNSGNAAGLDPSEFNKVTHWDDPMLDNANANNDKVAACTIRVWAPVEVIPTYTALMNEFTSDSYHDGKYSNVTINFQAMEEGEVRENLGTDASAGADVFFFPSDHMGDFIKSNYLAPLRGATGSYYSAAITQRDSETTYAPAMKDGYCYAFPTTSDNGYYLVYNKNDLTETEAGSLDTIIAKAKTANKSFMYRYGTGFYAATFFFGEGVELDANGADSDFSSFMSESGERGAKAMIKYINSGYCQDGETPAIIDLGANGAAVNGIIDGTLIAGVCGAWEAPTKEQQATVGLAKLPTFTSVDGSQKQMGSFFGGKYCGVNSSSQNQQVAMAVANFLTNTKAQTTRFAAHQAGPTNKVVSNLSEVKENAPLAALAAQVAAGGVLQGNIPGTWWSGLETYVDDIEAGNITETNLGLADMVAAMTPEKA